MKPRVGLSDHTRWLGQSQAESAHSSPAASACQVVGKSVHVQTRPHRASAGRLSLCLPSARGTRALAELSALDCVRLLLSSLLPGHHSPAAFAVLKNNEPLCLSRWSDLPADFAGSGYQITGCGKETGRFPTCGSRSTVPNGPRRNSSMSWQGTWTAERGSRPRVALQVATDAFGQPMGNVHGDGIPKRMVAQGVEVVSAGELAVLGGNCPVVGEPLQPLALARKQAADAAPFGVADVVAAPVRPSVARRAGVEAVRQPLHDWPFDRISSAFLKGGNRLVPFDPPGGESPWPHLGSKSISAGPPLSR